MKALILTTFLAGIFLLQSFSQAPHSFSYQAIARDSSGNLITSHPVSVRISILSDSVTGLSVYSERHALTTSAFGLITMQVGRGAPHTGDFNSISWGSTTHFIKTEMDPNGDTSYLFMGTSELLSVPYALYAGKAAPSNIAGYGISVSGDTIKNLMPNEFHTGDATGNTELTVRKIQGRLVDDGNPGPGQIFKWNMAENRWALSSDENTTYSAGTGLSLNGTTFNNTAPDQTVVLSPGIGIAINGIYPAFSIKNTAPDQTVVLNNGTAISVTGTYPNFTINNSAPDQTVVLTNGSGISISGTYPSFTITNSSPNATHTGDATGATALTVVKLQGRSVSSNSPSTNQVLKWNGSTWIPLTDETRDGCPANFTSVNNEYCIYYNIYDAGRTWFDAAEACGTVGAHLCSWGDWYYACYNAVALGIQNMTGYIQWLDDAAYTDNYAKVAGTVTNDCTGRDSRIVTGVNAYTRCCFNK